MFLFHTIAALIALTAIFAYLSHRFLNLHPSIGVMLIAMILSLAMIPLEHLGLNLRPLALAFLRRISFNNALLQWMLGFLLFAGALTVDVNELARQRAITFVLATLATIASMFIVALLTFYTLSILHIGLPLIDCLLFGALISPTDPIAVVALMKTVGAPRNIQTIVSAESLFNDGVGVVLFLTVLAASHGATPVSLPHAMVLLLQESLGGAALGLATGYLTYRTLRTIENYQLEVLLTLALVMGASTLSDFLHVSGPIATVVAGLLIGNRGKSFNLAENITHDLFRFWELIEELLNATLFVLMGLVILILPFTPRHLTVALLCIPVVLLARWLSVTATVTTLSLRQKLPPGLIPILTWGGLRGGLPIAMALTIPPGPTHDTIISITYAVVAFSILIQGTTLRPFIAKFAQHPPHAEAPDVHPGLSTVE